MKKFLFGLFMAILASAGICLDADYSYALKTGFHGRLQSNYVVRDTNGFQNKFMDSVTCSQWLTELKFDLTIRPEKMTYANVSLEKIFLSYRGSYDAVFDVTDKWDDVRDKSPGDFELGKDDLKVENDLREAFVDFVSEFGSQQSIVLRLGRQIVQWGEADGFNVVNIINPQDNSNKMFFDKPEDLAIPLWMARLDYSTGMIGPFNSIDFQFVAIPDIRPHQFAPLDSSATGPYDHNNAPYAFGFREVKDWGIPCLTEFLEEGIGRIGPKMNDMLGSIVDYDNGLSVSDGSKLLMYTLPDFANGPLGKLIGASYESPGPIELIEDVPASNFDNMEYGGKVRLAYGCSEVSFYYLRTYQDDPAINLSEGLTRRPALIFEHPEQDMYGFSFNTYVAPINAVIRAEGNIVSKMSFYDTADPFTQLFFGVMQKDALGFLADILPEMEFGLDPSMKGYTMHRVYQSLVGFDKSFWIRWMNSHNMINASLQAYWKHICDFDYDSVHRPWDQDDSYRFTGFFWTDYMGGKVHPELFIMYDPEDAWMTNLSIKYTRDGQWFYKFGFMGFWGDEPSGNGTSSARYSRNATGAFTTPVNLIRIGELSFTVGYNW